MNRQGAKNAKEDSAFLVVARIDTAAMPICAAANEVFRLRPCREGPGDIARCPAQSRPRRGPLAGEPAGFATADLLGDLGVLAVQ